MEATQSAASGFRAYSLRMLALGQGTSFELSPMTGTGNAWISLMPKQSPMMCNVRDMEGLAASVLLIAILLGVLLVVGGLVYLLAQRLRKRLAYPPTKPVNRWIGLDGSSWPCSSSDYGRGLSQPQTPSRSLVYSRPARPGPYGHPSRGCASSYEVIGP